MYYSIEKQGFGFGQRWARAWASGQVLREMGGDMEISPGERGLVTMTCLIPRLRKAQKNGKGD